jgi:hypothetical protein
MQQEYIAPSYSLKAFHCPHCNVYADQHWDELAQTFRGKWHYDGLYGTTCAHCGKGAIWFNKIMIYPDFEGIQPPNQDLSNDIQSDYQEAASILQKSPRGAAALLRLAIQKLCGELGEKGKNINDDIKNLVTKGLPSAVQKSLDAVRVIGNDAVHPGQIDLKDNIETAKVLFKLVNIIAEKMITEPKEVEEIYNSLPEEKRQQIEARDGVKSKNE